MRAGLLTEIITLQNVVKSKDDFGGSDFIYEDVIPTRARVVFKGENRETNPNELHYITTLEFTIRKYHSVNEDMVVLYKNKHYRILSIDYTIRDQITLITELIND